MATGQLQRDRKRERKGKRESRKEIEELKGSEEETGRQAELAQMAGEKVSAYTLCSVTKHRIHIHIHIHIAMFCQVDQQQLESAVGVF